MPDLALSGIASGVDTESIITKIMAAERQSLKRNQLKDKGIEARQTGLRDVQAKLKSLKGAAEALRAPALWLDTQTVDSSDPARIAVQRTGMVPAGGYSIQVRQLAAAEREGFTYVKSDAASQISIDGAAFDIAAGAGPAEVATAINGRSDLSVYATALDDDTIVFSARKTGSVGAFSVTGPQLSADPVHTRGALDAEYSLDGGATWASSPTQTLEGVIPGLTVTMKSVTATPVTLNANVPGLDQSAVKDKLKSFISAYNELISYTRAELDETTFRNPRTDSQAAKGALFGDTGLSAMLSTLRRAVSDQVAGMAATPGLDELVEIGISTGKGSGGASTLAAKQGKLVLDEAALTKALADPAKVRSLLGGSGTVPGFAQRIESLVDKQAGTGGVLDERVKIATSERSRLVDQTAQTERRLANKEKRLRAQFAAMETALNQSQSQSSWLAAQLGAFNR